MKKLSLSILSLMLAFGGFAKEVSQNDASSVALRMMVEKDVAVLTNPFFDMGIKLSYDFRIYRSIALQINGGVKNIFNAYQKDFDQGPDRDAGYIYGPSLPRTIFVGAKLTF